MAVTPLLSLAASTRPEPCVYERAPPTVATRELAYGAECLIAAYRFHGHRAATIDPLSERKDPFAIPELDPRNYALLLDDAVALPVELGGVKQDLPLSELLGRLKASYCGPLALECAYVRSDEQRRWLYGYIEAIPGASRLTDREAKRAFEQLVAAEVFERHRRDAYAQYKQFNLQGGESFVPLMRALVEEAARQGTEHIVLAMPHRGRLNVMLNALDVPPERLLSLLSPSPDTSLAAHDLRDHAGLASRIETAHGVVALVLLHNPSHLEAVAPVACGMARALQEREGGGSTAKVLPVLVHGDGSFCGQGVVAETFNMSQTRGYGVGGTLHVILNNQVGSTIWHPRDQRSTLYCADLSRAFDAPVVHVNADEPDAVIAAIRLGAEFRQRFHADIVIDHVGYRRYGHWVGDDPTLTRPAMQRRIERHPSVVSLYASALVRRGVVREEDVERIKAGALERLIAARPSPIAPAPHPDASSATTQEPALQTTIRTAMPIDRLREHVGRLATKPTGFTPHATVDKVLGYWRAIAGGDDRPVDWRLAENLAYATLLANGFSIRLAGLDVGRGSFCHRLHVWHDWAGENDWQDIHVPLRGVAERQGTFSVFESPLSEEAVLGFEYGYSLSCGRDLVVWEGQFGDFVNNAQVMIDQFVATGEAKWSYRSGLTMLLPHGEDGLGPEHSCAFVGRFLQLCAGGNLQVALPSTAAQIYHLLRGQALRPERTPLIVMTPHPWLYGHAPSHSRLAELAEGGFEPLLAEPVSIDPMLVRRVVVTSGKLYYDLTSERERAALAEVPVFRAEELYPFPVAALGQALARYPRLERVVWAQEEPKNHGAWYLVREQLESALPPNVALGYVGRSAMAPAAGADPVFHATEQRAVARAALGLEPR
jgi:2-oxoglutarate dehydrogenase E1 component